MQKRSVGLCTLGCKVAQYETEALSEAFSHVGFTVRPFESVCDVYVINTCTVTAESDRKSRQMIRRAHKYNPHAVIMVTGCYAQSAKEKLLTIDGVAYVSGNEAKMQMPKRAIALLDGSCSKGISECYAVQEAVFEPMQIEHAPRTRAYIKIEDGCDAHCTYCAIAAARGCVRSKAPEDVLDEVATLASAGTREVVLTGIETSAYGRDLHECTLVDLLERLDERRLVERIRLGSMSPEFFREKTVARLARLSSLTPHFHLSLQSGSTAVLNRMKRRYTREMALSHIKNLRKAIPNLELTADFIVGFPGETEEDFRDTVSFVQEVQFLDLHVFAYSPRENTPAAAFEGQIAEDVKRNRSKTLISVGHQLRQARFERVAQEDGVEVLFEQRDAHGLYLGHTASFIPVAVQTDEDLHGQIKRVDQLHVEKKRLTGRLLP